MHPGAYHIVRVDISGVRYANLGRSSDLFLPRTCKSRDGGRTSTCVFWGLRGGDVGSECSHLGVTGIVVDVAGGVLGYSMLGDGV